MGTKTIRRLVLCLDGTWNDRDDSTNVLQHYSLAYECNREARPAPDGSGNVIVTQQRFYNPGVGTGPLDRITGGGFGLGLEDHVRDTYDWLVQNFEDGEGYGHRNFSPDSPADEIYIFGFSRGAYEARSLVGFISTCGLLRRGAPLTVSQLWENYCLLGRDREERDSFWRKIFPPGSLDFRRITSLVQDSWLLDAGKAVPAGQVPGQRATDLNDTEKLLVRWSRRVKITYLGVYDTVGAIGWDALAIPGLRSKLALHNNVRPTTIITHCRHALAINENRSSFERTAFVAYLGPKTSADEVERSDGGGAGSVPDAAFKMQADTWKKLLAGWENRIEQRWFVGAHSNIGGGYPDNGLAQVPLTWLVEGAKERGLLNESVPAPAAGGPTSYPVRDSFAEFAPPLWELILRAKRNYRIIDPPAELRANRDEHKKADAAVKPGFSLVNIHEDIDASVFTYYEAPAAASGEANDAAKNAPPPNLLGYASRALAQGGAGRKAELEKLMTRTAMNPWLAAGFKPALALVLWATLAGLGLAVTDRFFCVWTSTPPAWLLAVLAALFALVDSAESKTNFRIAQSGTRPWMLAFRDAIYWARALGVVFFFFGSLGALFHLWHLGWRAESAGAAFTIWVRALEHWWCVPMAAVGGVILGHFCNEPRARRLGPILGACATALLMLGAIPLIVHLAQALGHVILAAFHHPQGSAAADRNQPGAPIGGLLLLLQLGFVYLLKARVWSAEPMNTANLGSMTALQKPWTPAGITACLNRWCKLLGDHHNEKASECAMTEIAAQCLWRDVFGFIPVYSLVLGFGLWFGMTILGWDQWLHLPWLWLIIPLITLATDYLEDICHFHFLSVHRQGQQPPLWLTVFSRSCTGIKDLGVLVEFLATVAVLVQASVEIGLSPALYGWRGLLALTVSAAALLVILVLLIWSAIYRLVTQPRNT